MKKVLAIVLSLIMVLSLAAAAAMAAAPHPHPLTVDQLNRQALLSAMKARSQLSET